MLKFNIKKHYLIEKDRYQLYPQGVIEGIDVTTISRPLTMHWTPEMAQDVSAFHNIDAEAELTAMLSEQVAAEIDREILRSLWDTASVVNVPILPFTKDISPTRNIKKHHFIPKKEIDFSALMFPEIRRVNAMTMGIDLVSVVPMSAPVGNLLYIDYNRRTIEPTVNGDGSWHHGKTFGSTLIDFKLKPHIFIKKPFPGRLGTVRGGRRGPRRPTRLNRR